MPYKDPEQRRAASKRHYEQNREYYREYRLQNREKQRERSCKVCRRGLAHSNCNIAVGMAADDPEKLRVMADELEAAQAAVESRKAAMSEQLTLDIS